VQENRKKTNGERRRKRTSGEVRCGARGDLARLARRTQNEDEEMGDTEVKKKK
jgi:hypothetical protein